jgi:hypothetical protein
MLFVLNFYLLFMTSQRSIAVYCNQDTDMWVWVFCSVLSVLDGLYYLNHISSTSGYMTTATRFIQFPIYKRVICALIHLC